MLKIDFHNKKVNLYNISYFAFSKNLDHTFLLREAFKQEVLPDENR